MGRRALLFCLGLTLSFCAPAVPADQSAQQSAGSSNSVQGGGSDKDKGQSTGSGNGIRGGGSDKDIGQSADQPKAQSGPDAEKDKPGKPADEKSQEKKPVSDKVRDQFERNSEKDDLEKPADDKFRESLSLSDKEKDFVEAELTGRTATKGELLTELEDHTRRQSERLMGQLAENERLSDADISEARRLVYARSVFLEPSEREAFAKVANANIPSLHLASKKLGLTDGQAGVLKMLGLTDRQAGAPLLRDSLNAAGWTHAKGFFAARVPAPPPTTASGPHADAKGPSSVATAAAAAAHALFPGASDPRHGVVVISDNSGSASGAVISSIPKINPKTGKPGFQNVVLTAGHVAEAAGGKGAQVKFKIKMEDGQYRTFAGTVGKYSHRDIGKEMGQDVAFMTFWSDSPMPTRQVAGADASLKPGDKVTWVGLSPPLGESEVTPHKTRVKENWRFTTITNGRPSSGHSGGPLLDKQGRVVGVVSGESDEGGTFANLNVVRGFLGRHGLLAEAAQAASDEVQSLVKKPGSPSPPASMEPEGGGITGNGVDAGGRGSREEGAAVVAASVPGVIILLDPSTPGNDKPDSESPPGSIEPEGEGGSEKGPDDVADESKAKGDNGDASDANNGEDDNGGSSFDGSRRRRGGCGGDCSGGGGGGGCGSGGGGRVEARASCGKGGCARGGGGKGGCGKGGCAKGGGGRNGGGSGGGNGGGNGGGPARGPDGEGMGCAAPANAAQGAGKAPFNLGGPEFWFITIWLAAGTLRRRRKAG